MSESMTQEQIDQVAYLYGLSLLDGIGPKSVLNIVDAIPQLPFFLTLFKDQKALANILPESLVKKLGEGLTQRWESVFATAQQVIEKHLEKGILPLPITSDKYPVLLTFIKDPPAILYIKGDQDILNNVPTIAIIGTREATARGLETARTIAFQCAKRGCVIVSGLAKGTDTAAHQGAIEAGGKTIAVFATPLDNVYPAENKRLADQICHGAGVLISEYPIGMETQKGFFVARDRLQSGISLGVIPIQTDINGGTMHTVRHAREQQRPLFCPTPPEEEKQHEKYRGIRKLLEQMHAEENIDKTNRAINPFPLNNPRIYDRLLERLEEQRRRLYEKHGPAIPAQPGSSTMQTVPTAQTRAIQTQGDQVMPEPLPKLYALESQQPLIEQPTLISKLAVSVIPVEVDSPALTAKSHRTNAITAPPTTDSASVSTSHVEGDVALPDQLTDVASPLSSVLSVEPASAALTSPVSPPLLGEAWAQSVPAAIEAEVMKPLEADQTEIACKTTTLVVPIQPTSPLASDENTLQPTAVEVICTEAAEMSSETLLAAHPLPVPLAPDLATQTQTEGDGSQMQEAVLETSADTVELSLATQDQRNVPGDEANIAAPHAVDAHENQASAPKKQKVPVKAQSTMPDAALDLPEKPPAKKRSPVSTTRKTLDASVEKSHRREIATSSLPQSESGRAAPKRRARDKTLKDVPELWDIPNSSLTLPKID